jgi:hypothetical protein
MAMGYSTPGTGGGGSKSDKDKGKAGNAGNAGGASKGPLSQAAVGALVDSIAAEDEGGLGFAMGNKNALGGKKTEGGVGGGTTTTPYYTPGGVPNFPEADALTVFEKIVAPMIPGLGGAIGAVTAGKMVADGDTATTTVFGGDPGPQKGWQPDRFKGQANMSGVGDPGSASGEQSIPGKPYGAGTIALTGDEDEPTGAGTEQIYSDVTLRDRRKPKKVGAGTEIVLGA